MLRLSLTHEKEMAVVMMMLIVHTLSSTAGHRDEKQYSTISYVEMSICPRPDVFSIRRPG